MFVIDPNPVMARDCGPSHPQNFWIFRFVSLKFLIDAQEKIK